MKPTIILLLLAFGLQQCAPKPAILSRNKMKDMLMDMHLAESLAQHLPKDSLHFTMKNEDSLLAYNAAILSRYKVTAQDFNQSLNYYKSQPEVLDSIYQELLADIAIKQAKLK